MSSRAFRRAGLAGLALTLAGGVVLASPQAAQAGVLDTATLQSLVSFSGSGTCVASGTGSTTTPVVPFLADGVTNTSSSSSSYTYTKSGDPSDVTDLSGSVTTTVKATQANNALRTVDFSVNANQTVTSTKGAAQACNASTAAAGVVAGSFDLPSPKVVTVDSEASPGEVLQVTVLRTVPTTQYHQVVSLGVHSTDHAQFTLGAGTYTLQIIGQAPLSAPTPTGAMASPQVSSATASLVFNDPGVAEAASTGDGGKYVALAEGRSCAGGSLAATWKSKAGKGKNAKIKKAVFTVNGAKVQTVKKPKKGTTTTVTGLPAGKNVEVAVTMKLVKKGAGSVSLERSYLACS